MIPTTKSETKRPVKVNGYNSSKLNARRNLRRREADDRQFKYETLTKDEKINLVKSRPGENKRELARLQKSK